MLQVLGRSLATEATAHFSSQVTVLEWSNADVTQLWGRWLARCHHTTRCIHVRRWGLAQADLDAGLPHQRATASSTALRRVQAVLDLDTSNASAS